MARGDAAWLDAAEEAGRAALADDLSPDELATRIPPWPAAVYPPETELPYGMLPRPGAGLWWTEGSPRVPAQGLVLDAMPDVATFVAMLDASFGAPRGGRLMEQFRAWAVTHPGTVRDHNEDVYVTGPISACGRSPTAPVGTTRARSRRG